MHDAISRGVGSGWEGYVRPSAGEGGEEHEVLDTGKGCQDDIADKVSRELPYPARCLRHAKAVFEGLGIARREAGDDGGR